jgi:hypothetical protein
MMPLHQDPERVGIALSGVRPARVRHTAFPRPGPVPGWVFHGRPGR